MYAGRPPICDPVTATLVAATIVTAGTQVYGGMVANQQGKYEAKIATRNAALERESIKDAEARRGIAQQQHWRKVASAMGMQRAQAAAGGLDVNFGSPGDLQDDTLMIGYEDASTINENFAKEIKGYDINASNDIMQGRAAKARGKAALISGGLSAAGTILGGASQVAKYNAGQAGGNVNFGSTGG